MASYQGALEAAGADVLKFKEFGDYQGTWIAKVNYEGNTFWVTGSYGSCSGCDAIQAEFDYHDERCDTHKYNYDLTETCKNCAEEQAKFEQKYKEFGESYLGNHDRTQEEFEAELGREIASKHCWDKEEKKEMLKFVRED